MVWKMLPMLPVILQNLSDGNNRIKPINWDFKKKFHSKNNLKNNDLIICEIWILIKSIKANLRMFNIIIRIIIQFFDKSLVYKLKLLYEKENFISTMHNLIFLIYEIINA